MFRSHVARCRTAVPFVHTADATDTARRLLDRYGQNVWGLAVSRKNWLFAGSERGGDAAAVAFSLIETARLNDVEPYAYLCDVLARINRHRVDRLAELLPFHWKASR